MGAGDFQPSGLLLLLLRLLCLLGRDVMDKRSFTYRLQSMMTLLSCRFLYCVGLVLKIMRTTISMFGSYFTYNP